MDGAVPCSTCGENQVPSDEAHEAVATYADLAALPPVISAVTADAILGIGSSLGRALRKRGEYPVPVLAGLGRHHKVSTVALLRYLGVAAGPSWTRADVAAGSVRQRHTARCPRAAEGGWAPHKCRGPWWWVLDLGPDPLTGKRRQPSKSGFPTRAAAEADLREARARLLVTQGRSESMTVGQWLDSWCSGLHKASPTTRERYEDICRLHLVPHLGQLPLVKLTPEHVDLLISTVSAPDYRSPVARRSRLGLSSASIHRVHACLHRALAVAVKRRLLTWNPAAAVELPPEVNEAGRAWMPSQVTSFLKAVEQHRLACAWRCALLTGARRGELTGLTWERVDLGAGLIVIVQTRVHAKGAVVEKATKSRAGMRAVYLDRVTCNALSELRKRQQQEFRTLGLPWSEAVHVLTSPTGEPLVPAALTTAWRSAINRVNREHPDLRLPVIKLHEARHTANTLARLYARVDGQVLLERMGHTKDVVNGIYTHGHPVLHQQAAEDIAAALLGTSVPTSHHQTHSRVTTSNNGGQGEE